MKPLIMLYHGTNSENATRIEKNGYLRTYTYFAKDLFDALEMGGPIVFCVLFLAKDIPDNWQVRCCQKISISRVVEIHRFKRRKTFVSQKLQQILSDSNINNNEQKDYTFNDNFSIFV